MTPRTHPLDFLDLHIDLADGAANDLVVLGQVHPQQVVVDQPQRHVTSKTGHRLGQMVHLVVRGLFQAVLGVQKRAKVGVLLKEGRKVTSEVPKAETAQKHSGPPPYFITRGKSKRDRGDPGKCQERIGSVVQLQRLQTARRRCEKEVNIRDKRGIASERRSTHEQKGGLNG